MFKWLTLFLLLLFCPVNYNEIPSQHVTAKKGDNATIQCNFTDNEVSHIKLFFKRTFIPVCQNEECMSKNGRVFKEGSCDVVIKDLIYSDAGKYILYVYYSNDQTVVESKALEYRLRIHDEISVKKGKELELDFPLINTDQVMHAIKTRTKWKEIWTTGQEGVQSDRLTIKNGNLIIINFTAIDAGSYIFLGFEEEILINVTLTESSTDSRNIQNTPEQPTVEPWNVLKVVGVVVGIAVILLLLLLLLYYCKKQGYFQRCRYMSAPTT